MVIIKLKWENCLYWGARTFALLWFDRVIITALVVSFVIVEVTTASIVDFLIVSFSTATDLSCRIVDFVTTICRWNLKIRNITIYDYRFLLMPCKASLMFSGNAKQKQRQRKTFRSFSIAMILRLYKTMTFLSLPNHSNGVLWNFYENWRTIYDWSKLYQLVSKGKHSCMT